EPPPQHHHVEPVVADGHADDGAHDRASSSWTHCQLLSCTWATPFCPAWRRRMTRSVRRPWPGTSPVASMRKAVDFTIGLPRRRLDGMSVGARYGRPLTSCSTSAY